MVKVQHRKKLFAPGTLLDPLFAPPSDHWQGNLSISLGVSHAWNPKKVEGGGLQSPCPCRLLRTQSRTEPAELGLEVCELRLLFRRQSLSLSLSLPLLLRPHLMHLLRLLPFSTAAGLRATRASQNAARTLPPLSSQQLQTQQLLAQLVQQPPTDAPPAEPQPQVPLPPPPLPPHLPCSTQASDVLATF